MCGRCKQFKELTEFSRHRKGKDGYYCHCKTCKAAFDKEYYRRNREHIKLKVRKRALLEDSKAARNSHSKKRYSTDRCYRLTLTLRNRLNMAIRGETCKNGSAIKDLGCSTEELIKHLESQFLPDMSWDNYGRGKGKWSIDHIVAISTVDLTDREQFLKIVHYSNLRPLWNDLQLPIYYDQQRIGYDRKSNKSS